MSRNTEKDPLFYGTISMGRNEIPKFESGRKILSEVELMMEKDQALTSPLKGNEETLNFFTKMFPEIAQSNSVGQLNKKSFQIWEAGQNEVVVEMDPAPPQNLIRAKDVYVGGPAALFAAAIQAKSGDDCSDVLYCHDGNRGASNWKGSASYFHVRDAIPVYYWPDNHGAYVLYATVKHWLQRRLDYANYIKEVAEDPNWNKLRLNLAGLIKEPQTLLLFAKNQLFALKDVGLHIEDTRLLIYTLFLLQSNITSGTNLAAPEDTTAYLTTHHAFLSHEILDQLCPPKPVIMQSMEDKKALHLHLGGTKGLKEANGVFKQLSDVSGDVVMHRKLTETELTNRGCDLGFVTQALEFPHDGYIPPYVDNMLEEMVDVSGGRTEGGLRLKKILVAPVGWNDTRVSQVVFDEVSTGAERMIPVKSLYLSLGPSMRNLKVLTPHKARPDSGNLLNHTMWAAGSSIVFIVKIDKCKVGDSTIAKFRDHIDAHNKHIVRLGERELLVSGKLFSVFCMQTTGGGHFLVKDAHAETAINVFKANALPLLGLQQEGIEYDIVSTRSCARGITAQNVFRLTAPASNMVMLYGIGGIGMSTMAPNGLLMKAVMNSREELALGKISNEEWQMNLQTAQFTIPQWKATNPFQRNYAQFMDNIEQPEVFAKYLKPTHSYLAKLLTIFSQC